MGQRVAPGEEVELGARVHAAEMGLAVDYRCASAEALAETGAMFNVVLILEIVEHVADLDSFLDACCRLVAPGGMLVAATLNRTIKSYAMAIVGAEYLLRWLPVGTHSWSKFVRPSELATCLRRNGLALKQLSGVAYNPISDRWHLAPQDLDVNYMAYAERT